MHETNTLLYEDHSRLKVASRILNLWTNINLFVVWSSSDSSFLDYLMNKVVDYSIDRISKQNTYKDFSNALEHINSVLKTWNNDTEWEKMNMVIWVLNDNEFLFSNIWKTSCYLVKKNNVIEITDKKDKKKEFSFISNWDLEHNDIITIATKRLFNFLSESDFIDSYSKKIETFNESINGIIEWEKINKNIAISSFSYKSKKAKLTVVDNWSFFQTLLFKIWDNDIVKKIIALYLILKERLMEKWKLVKIVLFLLGIFLAIFLLFKIIDGTVTKEDNSQKIEIQKEVLEEAKVSLRKASESIKNKDIFNLNIKNAESRIADLEKENLFANDVSRLKSEIAQIKKTFNWIESFEESDEKKMATFKDGKKIKILWLNKKIYVVWEKSITWPIIEWQESKTYTFEEIWDDSFVDATPLLNSISLVTTKWQIVTFTTDWNFSFTDVLGQDAWTKSSMIDSYASNIYLISEADKQIYKHKKSGRSFWKWTPYLKKEDQQWMDNMIDIAIDGGFYILKKDLSFVKFFSTPYRLESLVVNKAPENYAVEDPSLPLKIKTRQELNYVYMLMNNKIYIFKPNSTRYQDTKALNYIGQIEWRKFQITDFYVKFDWELMILNEWGIYKMNFEVTDDKLLLR